MKIIEDRNEVYILNDALEKIAFVEFPFVDLNTIEIKKTFVDNSLRGQGIASMLMERVASIIEKNHYQVILTCSYAKKYFETHPF